MSDSNRSLFQVHFHSHGDVQFGPRSLGRGTEETEESAAEPEAGLSVGAMALMVFGLAVGVALVRRRRRQRRERAEPEQKNLDRWIPTR